MAGDQRATARACRWVDEQVPGWSGILQALYPGGADAWIVGVTGSPGVGKSTLSGALVKALRGEGRRVGVVAVDPTSPLSGGAILGDRIRMQRHFGDPEVFIRSVATRGAHGGLSSSTADIVRVLAAWGADTIVLETVGVGQDELDVMGLAHCTLVVQAPGAGDELQAAKAGIMECADLFVVNKADLPGAEAAAQYLRSSLALGRVTAGARPGGRGHSGATLVPPESGSPMGEAGPAAAESGDAQWEVSVVKCVASSGDGVEDVLAEIWRQRAWLTRGVGLRERMARRIRLELSGRLRDAAVRSVDRDCRAAVEAAVARVVDGVSDPYTEAQVLVERRFGPPSGRPPA